MFFPGWILKTGLCLMIVTFKKNYVEASEGSYLASNEIEIGKKAISLPECRENSICGYLQANTRGVNQQRICACEKALSSSSSSASCPMTWDPFDGHSITQGSDQYKICEPNAPKLEMCEPNQTAYVSRIIFSKITDKILTKADYVKCICPESHNYEIANQHFEDLNIEEELMEFTHVCKQLPPCQNGDPCKTISEESSAFLVNRKCVCPSDSRCPTLALDRMQSVPFGKGRLYLIQCQQNH